MVFENHQFPQYWIHFIFWSEHSCVTVNTYQLTTLSFNMITPEISRSTWIEKKCQQENLHSSDNISMTSAHLGPKSEKCNLKHKHLADVHITWVNVHFFFLPSGISLDIIQNYITILYDVEFESKTKQAQGLTSSFHSFFFFKSVLKLLGTNVLIF